MRLKHIILLVFLNSLFLLGCVSYVNNSGTQIHASTKILPIKYGQIEYVRFGQGTPIVLINGYTADISSWDIKMLTILAKEHEVILLNNRNVGKSCVYSKKYQAMDLANDTYQLVKGLHLKKPAIVGYSMGGAVAQQYVVTYPNDVSKLILINTFIAGPKVIQLRESIKSQLISFPRNPIRRFFVALELFFPEGYRVNAAHELIFNRFTLPGYPIDNFPSSYTITQQQQLLLAWVKDISTLNKIEKMTVPTLILNGLQDTVIDPANSVVLVNNIRNATLLRWENGGHGMVFQFPEAIAYAINHFLRH